MTCAALALASRTLAQALSAPTMTFSITDEPGKRLHQLERAADAGAADLVGAPAVDALAGKAHLAGIGAIDAGDRR